MWSRGVLLLALVGSACAARADTVLLLHGYLSGPGHWRDSAVTAHLQRSGWDDGGTLRLHDGAVRPGGRVPASGMRRFHTLRLDSVSSLLVQLEQLREYVAWVRARYPQSPVILVGHSAGGVLGRLFMVRYPRARVAALISIASPHLGTGLADLGVLAGAQALEWLASHIGTSELDGLLTLLRQLRAEQPGSFLYALNRESHPAARYIAVVRTAMDAAPGGDLFVAERSQDLGRVAALYGRAETIRVAGPHALQVSDGPLLARLLRTLRQT